MKSTNIVRLAEKSVRSAPAAEPRASSSVSGGLLRMLWTMAGMDTMPQRRKRPERKYSCRVIRVRGVCLVSAE